jgi:cation transport ATPase
LDLICLTIEYAKRFRRVLLQTFLAAFIYNVAALTLVALELFSPLGAVVAMLFSFSVLFFSVLRLSKWEV